MRLYILYYIFELFLFIYIVPATLQLYIVKFSGNFEDIIYIYVYYTYISTNFFIFMLNKVQSTYRSVSLLELYFI